MSICPCGKESCNEDCDVTNSFHSGSKKEPEPTIKTDKTNIVTPSKNEDEPEDKIA